MGVWGAGIFSDDTAADVRDEYRNYLADGMDGPSATNKLLENFGTEVDDADAGPPFWLSLAATQWRLGRLEDRVRERALRIIDDGTDLARFSESAGLQRSRRRVLQKLRTQLCTPQHAPVKVRREAPLECDWAPGEVIDFRRKSGEWLALHVQEIMEEGRNRYPAVRVLTAPHERDHKLGVFYLVGMKKRDLASDRLRRTGKVIEPSAGRKSGFMVPWKQLDDYL